MKAMVRHLKGFSVFLLATALGLAGVAAFLATFDAMQPEAYVPKAEGSAVV